MSTQHPHNSRYESSRLCLGNRSGGRRDAVCLASLQACPALGRGTGTPRGAAAPYVYAEETRRTLIRISRSITRRITS